MAAISDVAKTCYYDSVSGKTFAGSRMVMGINSEYQRYFSDELMFINLIYRCQAPTVDSGSPATDANGWKTPLNTGDTVRYIFMQTVNANSDWTGPAQRLVIRWTGTLPKENISLAGNGTFTKEVDTANRIVYAPLTVSNGGLISVSVTGGGAGYTCTDIEIIEEDNETAFDLGQTVHPDFITRWSGVDHLRTINMTQASDNWIKDYADFDYFTDIFAAGKIPCFRPSDAAELCNALNCNLWWLVGDTCTDSCVTSVATELFNNLNSDLSVYVEYSNEIWNTNFAQQNRFCLFLDASNYEVTFAPATATATQTSHPLVDGDHIVMLRHPSHWNVPNAAQRALYGEGRNGWVYSASANTFVIATRKPLKLTNVTQANPGVVTTKLYNQIGSITLTGNDPVRITTFDPDGLFNRDHWLETGDQVIFQNVNGTTELNGNTYTVTRVSFEAFTLDGTDSANFSAYSNDNSGDMIANYFADGDIVKFWDVGGMTELNGNTYTVANAGTNGVGTFELSGTDTTAFTAYTSGGECLAGDTGIESGFTSIRYIHDNVAVRNSDNAYAQRSEEIWDLFAAVFPRSRLKFIGSTQAAVPNRLDDMLSRAGFRRKHDYIAIAPYMAYDDMPGYTTASPSAITAWYADNRYPTATEPAEDNIISFANKTGRYNIICYESGDHTTQAGDPQATNYFTWSASTAAGEAFVGYWKSLAGKCPILCHFLPISGEVVAFGFSWGLKTHQDEDRPKYDRFKELIDAGGAPSD